MATRNAVASGAWSAAGTWDTPPADGDAVIITAGCGVLMDTDLSAWTGTLTVTVQGHATTPGMLYFKAGTSGYLKIRTGYNLVGTSGAAKGRLLANSDGVWGHTGVLPYADKAVIDLGATSSIVATYLDIALYCLNPTHLYLRTYGARKTVTASASTDTFTSASHGLANATPVMVMSSGTLPAPLVADVAYYIVSTATNTFQLAAVSGGTAIDLTSDGTGTIEVYTGAASGANPVNVFEDVTAETGWTTATGHNRAVMVNAGPQDSDQQRVTLATIASGAITLSAALDSVQSPGARIYVMSRNVSIRSACASGVNIVDYGNASTSAGVFGCAIVATAGTGTTFYGTGVYDGTGHTISGTVSGCTYGVNYGTGHTISGTVSGCTYGVSYGTGHTISGTVSGCAYGVYYGTGHTISGTVSGCDYGVYYGMGHTISGTVSGCDYGVYYGMGHTISGTVSGCTTGFAFGDPNSNQGLSVVCRAATFSPSPPTFSSRNTVGVGSLHGEQGVCCEDYGGVLGASYAFYPTGDVIKNTTVTRSGGATSSLEVVPLSNCSTIAPIRVFEWTELDVPASAQTKSVYVKGEGRTTWPTAAQLYLEAEYLSDDSPITKTVVTSAQVLADNTTWTALSVTFTPHAVAPVRYRLIFGAYQAASKVYVDNMLVTA